MKIKKIPSACTEKKLKKEDYDSFKPLKKIEKKPIKNLKIDARTDKKDEEKVEIKESTEITAAMLKRVLPDYARLTMHSDAKIMYQLKTNYGTFMVTYLKKSPASKYEKAKPNRVEISVYNGKAVKDIPEKLSSLANGEDIILDYYETSITIFNAEQLEAVMNMLSDKKEVE